VYHFFIAAPIVRFLLVASYINMKSST